MADIGVIHIVYKPYGLPPFQEFLASYCKHPADSPHELILFCKGFDADRLPDNFLAQLKGIPHRVLMAPDRGFDLGSYFSAARNCNHRLLFFLNSRSVILNDGWLTKLRRNLDQPGVGIVGVAGNHESHHSNTRYSRQVHSANGKSIEREGIHRRLARKLKSEWYSFQTRLMFPPFPNPHLRTNAFLIERQRLLKIEVSQFETKMDCYRFESGKNGLTRQIARAKLSALVVGRDGKGYSEEAWPRSATFRSCNQENLLVADNQTRHYQHADKLTRQFLSYLSWGHESLQTE